MSVIIGCSHFIFRVFLYKSFFDKIIDNENVLAFRSHKRIWKVVVPLKVKVFMWALANNSYMTYGTFQKKRPNRNICSQCFIVCGRNESLDIVHWLWSYGTGYLIWWRSVG